jgi:uncharacterized protein (TIGR01777 family)
MNYFITGGLGFVGRHLSRHLLSQGHRVTAVGRRPDPKLPADTHFRYIQADTTKEGDWQAALRDQQVIINLAGKSIFALWTTATKQEILQSRTLTTRRLVETLPDNADVTLCSASAVGYYGHRGEDILTEEATSGNDFLAQVGREWEQEALNAEKKGARVILTRFGIVLDKDGGAMPLMRSAFSSFLGGSLGSGRQWFPWIHMLDLMAAFQFVISDPRISGPLNFCAPEPVRNRALTQILAKKLRRPAFMPAPSMMIRLVLGEFGQSLLNSQRAVPAKLQQFGFKFAYPHIEDALNEILAG